MPRPEANLARESTPEADYDRKIVSLKRGQMEHVNFHFTPLEPDAYRGRRTAILRVEQPNGTPAAGTKIIVSYLDGHYGCCQFFRAKFLRRVK